MARTPDLFDAAPPSALAEFAQAFERWLDSARRDLFSKTSSEEAAEVLWVLFTKWCLGQDPVVRLGQVSATDLELFIASRRGAEGGDAELSPRHVWRILLVIDRVLAHHAHVHDLPLNTAAREVLDSREEWRHANAWQRDPLPEFLTAADAKLLVDYLSQARPRPGRRDALLSWQQVRNRAAVALQLGAGLTPGEVRAMTVKDCIIEGGRLKGLPWKLQVASDGNAGARETPLAQWAAHVLRHWLTTRTEQGCGGDWLFPALRNGKPWGKGAQYAAVKEVLEASGLDAQLIVGGSFRLRHTFALRQLRRGRSPDEVARWLGVTDPEVMGRYQRVLVAPVMDVV